MPHWYYIPRRTSDSMDGTGLWTRETELIRAYGMTRQEARIYAMREAGCGISDIAIAVGAGGQTVKNTLTNARRKMDGDTEIIIYDRYEKSPVKTGILDTLMELCRLTTDLGMERLHYSTILTGSVAGDAVWMNDHVFRYADLHTAQSSDTPQARARRIADLYARETEGISEPKMGYSVVLSVLDTNFIAYDIRRTSNGKTEENQDRGHGDGNGGHRRDGARTRRGRTRASPDGAVDRIRDGVAHGPQEGFP